MSLTPMEQLVAFCEVDAINYPNKTHVAKWALDEIYRLNEQFTAENKKIEELQKQVAILHEVAERAAACIPIEFSGTHEAMFDALNYTHATAEAFMREHDAKVLRSEFLRLEEYLRDTKTYGLGWRYATNRLAELSFQSTKTKE